jgi:hypothetical protein
VTKDLQMPDEIQYYLARKYYNDIQALHNMFGGYTETWLRDAEKILGINSTEAQVFL